MTLRQLLALPVLASARPEVVHGADLLDRSVRWVHSSEIYEIGPLLKGGEVLLTTGLGLVGASPEQLRGYVADLTERSVTALVLELGRTFAAVPPDILEEARRRGLVLVALHGVVPFIEVTETVHQLLIETEVASLRRLERINTELTDSLLAGGGLRPLLRRIASLAGRPALLVAGDGRLVAASETDATAPDVDDPDVVRWAVQVFGVEWGHLVLGGPVSADARAVLDRGVIAVALELVRSAGLAPARTQASRELLRDIALNRFASAAELSARAAGVGVVTRPSERLVAVCLRVEGARTERTAINASLEAARRTFGPALVADVDGDLLMTGSAPITDDGALRAMLERLADTIDVELAATTGGRAVAVAAGPPVNDAPALVGAVAAAREASALARALGGHRRVLLSADLGVHRLLSRLVGDSELERFVEEQLGRLFDHDARRGRELVRTLDAYMSHGLSKTRTAAALGIRRQTLYARLARIEALLGDLDLTQRERRTGLDLALVAWRLRSSAVTRG